MSRSTSRYLSRRPSEQALIERVSELAGEWSGSGYRRIIDRLRAEGVVVNHKRVERLWREAGLTIKKREKRRLLVSLVQRLEKASKANERWALDFLSDRLENGATYRILAIIDVFTRECVAIDVARSMPAKRVVQVLERTATLRGLPSMLTTDNGPELISTALARWGADNEVTLWKSRPGTPTDNPFIESFNARLRAECVDLISIESIDEARWVLEQWRRRYNEQRGHSSLGRLTPANFAKTAPWVDYRVPVARTA